MEKRLFRLLAELQYVPRIVSDGEFPHAVVKLVERIDHHRFVLQPLLGFVHVLGPEIERARKLQPVERFMLVWQGNHQLDPVL